MHGWEIWEIVNDNAEVKRQSLLRSTVGVGGSEREGGRDMGCGAWA